MSILELVSAGTLDLRLAALLWLIMEKRASVIVAALPRLAGKTTLLNALLTLLPSDTKVIELQGMKEDFSFERESRAIPSQTYLYCNEISDHTDFYLWGESVKTLFSMTKKGYAMGATMHADTPQEVLDILSSPPLEIPLELLSSLDLIVILQASLEGEEPVRRIDSVHLVESQSASWRLRPLAVWNHQQQTWGYRELKEIQWSLASKGLIGRNSLRKEIESRTRFLDGLLSQGVTTFDAVAQAVRTYHLDRAKEVRG